MSTQVRWCDADTRGWISRDPGGFAMGDANLYRAMGNALTDGTDPTGLSTLTVGLGAGISVSDIQFAGSIEFNIMHQLSRVSTLFLRSSDVARRFCDDLAERTQGG